MSANTSASWSAQTLRMLPAAPSGRVAFCVFILRKADVASITVAVGTGIPKTDEAGDIFPPTVCLK